MNNGIYLVRRTLLWCAAHYFGACQTLSGVLAESYLANNKYNVNKLINREITKPICHSSIGLLSANGARS
jgi:hypothetical protein